MFSGSVVDCHVEMYINDHKSTALFSITRIHPLGVGFVRVCLNKKKDCNILLKTSIKRINKVRQSYGIYSEMMGGDHLTH